MAVLGGLGAVSLVGDRFCQLGSQPTKHFGSQKNRKNLKLLFFRCGFKKCVFVEKRAIFLLFRSLVYPTGAVRAENGPQKLKWAKNAEKVDFPVLGAVLGETPADEI